MGTGARVLLVEDHEPTAHGWRRHLERAGHEVAWAATLKRARAHLAARTPDVVVLDLRLPDGDGATLASEIHRRGAAMVVASGAYDARRALELCDLCTVALPKPVAGRELCRAVELAHLQRAALSATLARFASAHALSPAETEAVLALAAGLDGAEQCERLGCGRGSLATYWHRILKKSGLRSQSAVLAALLREMRPVAEPRAAAPPTAPTPAPRARRPPDAPRARTSGVYARAGAARSGPTTAAVAARARARKSR
ncbi:MAG: response regulator [Polyangiaceae bacterium]|nr:response regulator [Polyangiaceae bacterium]